MDAAGRTAELVEVSAALPPDLGLSGTMRQHLLVDSSKARMLLGWSPGDASENVARSVRWHLAHPPADATDDFAADDLALGVTNE
jgi:nucleoside-diphosphate-sugar epimerase